jgi:hypothetical protein
MSVDIPAPVKAVLRKAGWEYVGLGHSKKQATETAKVARLQYLVNDVLYVDNRRHRQVEALKEAQTLVNEL